MEWNKNTVYQHPDAYEDKIQELEGSLKLAIETLEDSAEKAVIDFINSPTDDADDYWKLFKVKYAVNDALVEAVKYGFKRGYEAGSLRK